MGARRGIAGLAAAGLVLVSCGEQPDVRVETHDEAVGAIVDSLSGSWAWEATLLLDFAEQDLANLTERDQADLAWLESLAAHRLEGAIADDGSLRFAIAEADDDWLDVRVQLSELLHTDRMDPEVALHLAADVPRLHHLLVGLGDPPSADELRARIDEHLDGPAHQAALALLDGGWSGIDGRLDPGELELTEDDMAQLRAFTGELLGSDAEEGRAAQRLDAALSLHSFRTVPGGSAAAFDLHPTEAVEALSELLGGAGSWIWTWVFFSVDAPADAIENVGDVAFDDEGRLTEVTIEVLHLLRELERAAGRDVTDGPSEASSMTIRLSFTQHGAVDTALDVPDPVTVAPPELFDALDTLLTPTRHWEDLEIEQEAPPGTEPPPIEVDRGHPDPPSSGVPVGDEEGLAVRRQIVLAAAALSVYHQVHGVYADEALSVQYGYELQDPDVAIVLAVLEDDYACLEGNHRHRDEEPLAVMEVDGPAYHAAGELTCEELVAGQDRARNASPRADSR